MELFKLFKFYRVGKVHCKVNSDKNIRTEMKNNFSPEAIITHFVVCCTLYMHS